MVSKTQFQKNCEHALVQLVRAAGKPFSKKSLIAGNEENYIEGEVSGIQFRIYEDGAQISINKEDHRLEKEDYDSLGQLQEEFLAIFTRHLKKKNPPSRYLKETVECRPCKKKWEIGWMSAHDGNAIEHAVTCDCGKVLKTVRTTPDGPPAMILQRSYDKTVAVCLPVVFTGAIYPILADAILLAIYVLSWIGCATTLADEDNWSVSALVGIAIWSLLLISGAAAVGALIGHSLWWWWQ